MIYHLLKKDIYEIIISGEIMKKYLITVDLDGTLLYDFDSLSDELCLFMKKVQEQGHQIVIATGRPFRSSAFAYQKFGLETPIINYNGGLITHPYKKDFPVINYTIEKDYIIDIFENNLNHIRNAFSEVGDHIYLFREEAAIQPLLHKTKESPVFVGHLKNTLKENPNGFIIIGKQGHGKYIKDYVTEKFNGKVLCRIWDLKGEYDSIAEIYTPESNKGKALKYVADYLGYQSEDIIAFGDGHNDIEMLAFAGLGIAVKGSHPELLEVADIVLPETAKENAVMNFLSNYLKIK